MEFLLKHLAIISAAAVFLVVLFAPQGGLEEAFIMAILMGVAAWFIKNFPK